MTVTLTPQAEARLQALAERRGQAPDAVIETALDALQQQENAAPPAPLGADEAEQARLHQVMDEILAQARARVPGSGDAAARQAYRDAPVDAAIVEKYRRQGFDL